MLISKTQSYITKGTDKLMMKKNEIEVNCPVCHGKGKFLDKKLKLLRWCRLCKRRGTLIIDKQYRHLFRHKFIN